MADVKGQKFVRCTNLLIPGDTVGAAGWGHYACQQGHCCSLTSTIMSQQCCNLSCGGSS